MMRTPSIVALILWAGGCLAAPATTLAQEPYRQPPEAIVAMLDAPRLPAVSLGPDRRHLLLIDRENLPPVADLAAPMLRLAGARINPITNAPHSVRQYTGLTLCTLETGVERRVALPPGADLGLPVWSPDGSYFAFTRTVPTGVELWIAEVATATARPLLGPEIGLTLNPLAGPAGGFHWLADSRTLLVSLVPAGRGESPQRPATATGPVVQQTAGRTAPVRTFQDMLTDAHDEALFVHYFTAQLALIDRDTAEPRLLGTPALYSRAEPSPDGAYLLVSRRVPPFSYQVGARAFPEVLEVWDRQGGLVRTLAHLPLRDSTPIQGVPAGPRGHGWQSSADATLLWAEALDGGDPRRTAAQRDRLLQLAAPFDQEPAELLRTEHRFSGVTWLEDPQRFLVSEFDRDRRWTRTWLYRTDLATIEAPTPTLLWSRSTQDRYGDPGSPVTHRSALRGGYSVARLHGNTLFLTGSGATPQGDRPFLDALDLGSLQTTRLWVNEGPVYEQVVDVLAEDGSVLLTRRESPTEPPNYFVFDPSGDGVRRAITAFPDPTPALRQVHRELVTYSRADGVSLSATLYLPPGYEEKTADQRLPLLIWAYPREFGDSQTAGQVSGSPYRFVTIGGASHLFLLTQGYAILDAATMPVIGDPETMNDTFIEQIVASAAAAIDYAVQRGVADRERVAVGGHSYGAFMTAHLLAHSDLFRAGIARSGAYNRTLTPFGFQSERRTLWEAPERYAALSPFMAAHRITTPLLLIHGQIDNNAGTFPLQSERMYQAIAGHGGTARLVMLPHESHGYRGRESVLHVLAETIDWLDTHLGGTSPALLPTSAVAR